MALVQFVDDSAPYLNAQNLNNNFNELDSKIQSNIVTDNVTLTNISINSGATIYRSFTIPSKTGYTPIGISVHSISGPSSGYMIAMPTLSGDLAIYSGASSTVTISINMKVIYLKN